MRPTYNEINLEALRYNYSQIKTLLPQKATLLSIVKANAYGHGSVQIAHELEKLGESYFGVATVKEALELRDQNIKSNILILGSFFDGDIDDIAWHRFTAVCYRKDQLEKLNSYANSARINLTVHIKFDTGMGRLGFEWTDAEEIAKFLLLKKNLVIEGLMSHLACSEEEVDFNSEQLKRFEIVRKIFKKNGIKPKYFHISNSGAILRKLSPSCNLFRPGLALYGSYTSPELKKHLDLKQLMNLRSEITQIKDLEAGRSISYGRRFITSKKTRVAIIPIGYADGYDRRLSNKGRVIIKNKYASVVGTVCMDMLAIDITGIKGVKIRDRVTLTGYDGNKFISLDDIAEAIGTIPYEVMCGISERVIKKYI